ncbi:MAG: phthiocerol/phthiodiolone dimycocerosyl transferase family protein [Spirulinaceae cyanobacterium]
MPGRFLTPIERATEVMTQHQGTLNIVTIAHLRGNLDRLRLHKALTAVQAQHPHLQARIAKGLGCYCLRYQEAASVPLGMIPLSEDAIAENQLKVAIDTELNTPIASESCLMRCVLLWSQPPGSLHYLLVTLHHAIADGISALYLQQAILTAYAQGQTATSSPTPVSPAKLYSAADCLPSSLRGLGGLLQTLNHLPHLQAQIWQHSDRFPIDRWAPLPERRCGWLKKTLAPVQTQTLVQRSRQEKTTVQGVLCAALLQAMAQQCLNAKTTRLKVGCGSFVDLRSRGEPRQVPKSLGMFAGCVPSFHELTARSDFWEIARDVNCQLHQGLTQQAMFKTLGLSGWLIEQGLHQLDRVNFPLNVTNVGRVELPSHYGELELEEISFLPANSIFGRSISIAVTTYRDRMALYFVASVPSRQSTSLEQFAQQVMHCLQ